MFSNLYVTGISIREIEERCYFKKLPAVKYIMDMEKLQFNSNVTFLAEENGIKDTEHYIVTRRFLEAPEKMLGELFEE